MNIILIPSITYTNDIATSQGFHFKLGATMFTCTTQKKVGLASNIACLGCASLPARLLIFGAVLHKKCRSRSHHPRIPSIPKCLRIGRYRISFGLCRGFNNGSLGGQRDPWLWFAAKGFIMFYVLLV